MPRYKDITNQKFSRLTVVKKSKDKASDGQLRWECLCDCGNITTVTGGELRRGKSKSCGCLIKETATTHGATGTKTYSIWRGMKKRCSPKASKKNYNNYYGRGIKVCDRWLDFNNFLKDMKECPGPNYTIERINNDGNYEPGNCKWILKSEQSENTRRNLCLTYNGITYPMLKTLCDSLNLEYKLIQRRLSRGWSIDEAVNLPKGSKVNR